LRAAARSGYNSGRSAGTFARLIMTDEAQNVIVLKDAYDRRSESKGDSADHWTEIFVDNIKFGSLAQGSYGTAYLTAYQTRDQLAQYFAGLKRDWEMSNTWRSIMSPRATAWSCSDVVPGATGTPACDAEGGFLALCQRQRHRVL
jgi:hypothetical protein